VTGTGLAVAAAMGGFAGAILVANNLRDVASDGRAGKRTLAVVLGVRRTQVVFGGLLALPFVACLSVAGTHPGALVALGSLPLIVASVRRLAGGATGLALVAVLRETARAELGYAILLAVGLALR
jgi:1,4-dihydroxy-2-naphthoate polyprenyltransferase